MCFNRIILTLMCLSISSVAIATSINIPGNWSIESSVIYDQNHKKVGEFFDPEWFPYKTGKEFINSFKKGFPDDPVTTKFISSGSNKEVFWVCSEGEYHDGKGGSGIWYSRVFWVNGLLVVFYSYKSCQDNFEGILKIAQTLKYN